MIITFEEDMEKNFLIKTANGMGYVETDVEDLEWSINNIQGTIGYDTNLFAILQRQPMIVEISEKIDYERLRENWFCTYKTTKGYCLRRPMRNNVYCKKHFNLKCASCGNPANRSCEGYILLSKTRYHTEEAEIKCNKPLCRNCRGYTDLPLLERRLEIEVFSWRRDVKPASTVHTHRRYE